MPQRTLTMSDVSRQEFLELKQRLDDACHDVRQIKSDTADIIETFRALSGGFKVLQGLGKLARIITWFAGMVAACAAAWAGMKGLWK